MMTVLLTEQLALLALPIQNLTPHLLVNLTALALLHLPKVLTTQRQRQQ